MNSDKVVGLLLGLRGEANEMAAASSITRKAVDQWRARTLGILEDAFGHDSPAVRDFSRIRFEDALTTDVAERVLREKAAEEGTDLGGLRIKLPSAEKALRQGLHEAAELLLSLTI
jgi:hypothetical protein